MRLSEELLKARAKTADIGTVKSLNLVGKQLHDVSIIQRMVNLETLALTANEIKTLEWVESCIKLKELFLRNNQIAEINQLTFLRKLPELVKLYLTENPLCEKLGTDYRPAVLRQLPNLKNLDGIPVSETEVKAIGAVHVRPAAESDYAHYSPCSSPTINPFTGQMEKGQMPERSQLRNPQRSQSLEIFPHLEPCNDRRHRSCEEIGRRDLQEDSPSPVTFHYGRNTTMDRNIERDHDIIISQDQHAENITKYLIRNSEKNSQPATPSCEINIKIDSPPRNVERPRGTVVTINSAAGDHCQQPNLKDYRHGPSVYSSCRIVECEHCGFGRVLRHDNLSTLHGYRSEDMKTNLEQYTHKNYESNKSNDSLRQPVVHGLSGMDAPFNSDTLTPRNQYLNSSRSACQVRDAEGNCTECTPHGCSPTTAVDSVCQNVKRRRGLIRNGSITPREETLNSARSAYEVSQTDRTPRSATPDNDDIGGAYSADTQSAQYESTQMESYATTLSTLKDLDSTRLEMLSNELARRRILNDSSSD